MKTFYQFHGDLDWFKLDSLPKEAKLLQTTKSHTPQSSTVTGHAHTINSDDDFKVYEYNDSFAYEFSSPAKISHEEHRTLGFEPGIYTLEHEREEDPREGIVREVID